MANRWTKEQKQAIDARGSDLLIAAAAGSGKTAVLVERIITKLLREEQEIDRLLVVTFTNAAAAEMRERIGACLGCAVELYDENGETYMGHVCKDGPVFPAERVVF